MTESGHTSSTEEQQHRVQAADKQAWQAQQPAWQPPTRKPPLSAPLKRAAMVAGMVGFGVMSLGWGLFSAAAGIGLFGGFFVLLLGIIGNFGGARDEDYEQMTRFFEQLNLEAWIVPLVVVGIVGAALWAWSLFLSSGILRRAGHPSPWGVTWAGAGIAIAASWIVSWIAWLPLNFISFAGPTVEGVIGSGLVLGVVSLVLQVAIALVIGWFAWWWMAHVMRPAAASD